MRNVFFSYFRFSPSPNEVKSWQSSLRAVCNVLQYGSFEDNGIIVEYQLPLTLKRLDCIIKLMFRDDADAGYRTFFFPGLTPLCLALTETEEHFRN